MSKKKFQATQIYHCDKCGAQSSGKSGILISIDIGDKLIDEIYASTSVTICIKCLLALVEDVEQEAKKRDAWHTCTNLPGGE
jgi:hypothetical protein